MLGRWLFGADDFSHFKNRLGFATAQTDLPVIWLHAASVGELQSAKQLLDYLHRQYPQFRLLVTTNNPTALKVAQNWPGLVLQAAPLDTTGALRRFLKHWPVAAYINIEGELWPNRLSLLGQHGVPVVLVNARLSKTSAKRFGWLGIGREILAGVRGIFAQDVASGDRFKALTQEPVKVIQNLKSLAAEQVEKLEGTDLNTLFPREKTILAASTHKGEEAWILAAFSKVREHTPDAKLILAPRHPKRGKEVAALIQKSGFLFNRRGLGDDPDIDVPVYLADTLGEMAVFYTLAGITFVGGSLVDKGGHTPYEPALYRSAIVTGPYVGNFLHEYNNLSDSDACLTARNAPELAEAFITLLDTEKCLEMAERAQQILGNTSDATQTFQRLIEPLGLEEFHE
jgi:3-deoxy-D-manno-octulosonic-acid transferase